MAKKYVDLHTFVNDMRKLENQVGSREKLLKRIRSDIWSKVNFKYLLAVRPKKNQLNDVYTLDAQHFMAVASISYNFGSESLGLSLGIATEIAQGFAFWRPKTRASSFHEEDLFSNFMGACFSQYLQTNDSLQMSVSDSLNKFMIRALNPVSPSQMGNFQLKQHSTGEITWAFGTQTAYIALGLISRRR